MTPAEQRLKELEAKLFTERDRSLYQTGIERGEYNGFKECLALTQADRDAGGEPECAVWGCVKTAIPSVSPPFYCFGHFGEYRAAEPTPVSPPPERLLTDMVMAQQYYILKAQLGENATPSTRMLRIMFGAQDAKTTAHWKAQVDAAEARAVDVMHKWGNTIDLIEKYKRDTYAAQEQSKRLAEASEAVVTVIIRGSECGFCSEKTLTPHKDDCEVGILQAALDSALKQQPDQEPPEAAQVPHPGVVVQDREQDQG